MSQEWWISLRISGKNVTVPRHKEGASFPEEGTTEAVFAVTKLYGEFFNFQALHDKRAFDTMNGLSRAVRELGDVKDPIYFKATPGNAGHTCAVLLSWASRHPKAIWYVH